MKRFYPKAALLIPLLIGCESSPTQVGSNPDPTPPASPTLAPRTVAIGFGAAGTGGTLAYRGMAASAQASASGDSLVIVGSNGTLVIHDVRFIVSEFELKRSGAACDGATDEDACEKFEAPPSFLDLPLVSGTAVGASQVVPAGTYTKMEFEVENVSSDEDDSAAKRAQTDSLFTEIRATFPDWPSKASMVVRGTFTATDSATAVPFRAYFDAEIEIEREFSPALVVTETGAGEAVHVRIDPAAWFKRADGKVVDLSAIDYARTGKLVEFELDMEHGFGKAEHGDNDD